MEIWEIVILCFGGVGLLGFGHYWSGFFESGPLGPRERWPKLSLFKYRCLKVLEFFFFNRSRYKIKNCQHSPIPTNEGFFCEKCLVRMVRNPFND